VLPEENRGVVEQFLAAHTDFHLLDCGPLLEKAQIPLQVGSCLELLPHVHGTDGFFAAVMERDAAAA
jgi:16S rRNA (cytosine967-C5)-methyltransferase